MASFPESDFQICPLCKEMCGSPAPVSSNSSTSSSSSQTSNSSGGGGGSSSCTQSRRLHVLPCLHAFCRQCLEAQRHPTAGDSLKLRCPICDQKVVISEPSGMDALPSSNFLLSNLLDVVVQPVQQQQQHRVATGGSSPGSAAGSAPSGGSGGSALLLRRPHSRQGEPRCSSCDEGNAASSRCLDCQEHLCDNCVRAHQRLALSPPYSAAAYNILSVFPDRVNYCQHHDDESSKRPSWSACAPETLGVKEVAFSFLGKIVCQTRKQKGCQQ
ncbi:hypothetical protein E2320_002021, partial [Naja naja]